MNQSDPQKSRRTFWASAFWPFSGTSKPLPWLTGPGIALIVLLFVLPFWLVEVPPLIDIPGHMGAAAIEAAGPTSPLEKYFSYKWVFTLNIGDGVLMKLFGMPFGVLAAGWLSTVLATALYAGGCLATIRATNPRGGYGAGWALVYVFSFPLLTGFLNFILATGFSLIAFAVAVRLEAHPRRRAGVLIVLQPVAMLCHAIGGLLLALLIGANAFGRELDALPQGWWRPSRFREVMTTHDWRSALRRLAVLLWPLLATVVTIVLWKFLSPPPARSFNFWRWNEKEWYLLLTLRDQSMVLDYATTIACYSLILLGGLIGGRWTWARLLPGLAVLIEFIVIPSDINGSNFVDVRLLPVACMLLLGLMDWSRARPRVAWAVAYSGMVLLAVRLVVTAASFADYADEAPGLEFGKQPRAGVRRTLVPRCAMAQHPPRPSGQSGQHLSPGLGQRQLGGPGAAHGRTAVSPRAQFQRRSVGIRVVAALWWWPVAQR